MKIKVNIKDKKISEIRLNKYLSEESIFSRRETDKLIEKKLIHINDKIANLGDKVKSGDSIFINQKEIEKKYFIYYKPRGEETVSKIFNKNKYNPVGRLDKESEGLLIYTNDFSIIEKLLNPKNNFEREYIVETKEKMTPRVKTILERGINTQEGKYAPAKKVILEEENKYIVRIILTEGKKHEIRRMLNALNLTIKSLKRIRFDFLKLSNMKIGEFKELTNLQKEKLFEILNKF